MLITYNATVLKLFYQTVHSNNFFLNIDLVAASDVSSQTEHYHKVYICLIAAVNGRLFGDLRF